MHGGKTVQISSPVPNVEEAVAFYQRLDYQAVAMPEQKGVRLVSDGVVLLRLDQRPGAHAGLVYFVDDLAPLAKHLEEAGLIMTPSPLGVTVTDPNGVAVRFVSAAHAALSTPGGTPHSPCGSFYELSIETAVFDTTETFWTTLGFSVTARSGSNWLTLSDDQIRVGVYQKGTCPHVFRTPALTYFESDMAERLAGLKQAGWTFLQEMDLGNDTDTIGHGILEGPGGQHLFLFSV